MERQLVSWNNKDLLALGMGFQQAYVFVGLWGKEVGNMEMEAEEREAGRRGEGGRQHGVICEKQRRAAKITPLGKAVKGWPDKRHPPVCAAVSRLLPSSRPLYQLRACLSTRGRRGKGEKETLKVQLVLCRQLWSKVCCGGR